MPAADLTYWWRLFKKIALVTGVLLSFLGFIEILHAFSVLKGIHPVLGYAFLFFLIGLSVYFLRGILTQIYTRPRVLKPPPVEDINSPTEEECRTYLHYLTEVAKRLSNNPNLSSEDANLILDKTKNLASEFVTGLRIQELLVETNRLENELNFVMDKLDAKAKEEVAKSVRDIMLGVTLSPYNAADLIIVFYRNLVMVSQIISIYNNRPLLVEQVLVMRDVFKVVATVNFLNFGQKLLKHLLRIPMPVFGGVLTDITQGIGAGLMTSAAGHSTVYRCRVLRSWEKDAAVKKLSSHLRDFYSDVKNIFMNDVLPQARDKIYSAAPKEEKTDPQFWQKVTAGFEGALEAADSFATVVVRKPVKVSAQTVTKAGKTTLSTTKHVSKKTASGIFSVFAKIGSSAKKIRLPSKVRKKGSR